MTFLAYFLYSKETTYDTYLGQKTVQVKTLEQQKQGCGMESGEHKRSKCKELLNLQGVCFKSGNFKSR